MTRRTRSHENKATCSKQEKKGRCIWESVFYLSYFRSNRGFPFHPRRSLCGGPAALLRPKTEQVKHTGSRSTRPWRLQMSSVADRQKRAPTFPKTHAFVFPFVIVFVFTLWENKQRNQLGSLQDCAARIPEAGRRDAATPASPKVTCTQRSPFSRSAFQLWPIHSCDHLNSDADKHAHTHTCNSYSHTPIVSRHEYLLRRKQWTSFHLTPANSNFLFSMNASQ